MQRTIFIMSPCVSHPNVGRKWLFESNRENSNEGAAEGSQHLLAFCQTLEASFSEICTEETAQKHLTCLFLSCITLLNLGQGYLVLIGKVSLKKMLFCSIMSGQSIHLYWHQNWQSCWPCLARGVVKASGFVSCSSLTSSIGGVPHGTCVPFPSCFCWAAVGAFPIPLVNLSLPCPFVLPMGW